MILKTFVGANESSKGTRMDTEIVLVGQKSIQNTALLDFLHTSLQCRCSLRDAFFANACAPASTQLPCIILWDYNTERELLWAECHRHDAFRYIVFNVPRDHTIEANALLNGTHGVFFVDDATQTLCRGVRAVLRGELWFTRKTISNSIIAYRKLSPAPYSEGAPLTKREKQILVMLTAGHTNKQIAEDLFISANTVKTHIYSIYQKLNVSNRTQAMRWALEHS